MGARGDVKKGGSRRAGTKGRLEDGRLKREVFGEGEEKGARGCNVYDREKV